MKLVFIYGPPAAGKLTVAKEVAKLTGYKMFHNHMTVDLVSSILDRKSKSFWKLVDLYRLEMFETASKENIDGLIFTFVYDAPGDNPFIKETVKRVEKHGGKVCFVQLYCDVPELMSRVRHPSRRNFTKIRTKTVMKRVLGKRDVFSKVPFKNNLSIDNTDLSPKRAAGKIVSHFRL